MTIRINVDGRLGTENDRLLSPLDLGFVFGASVYETLRTYGGRPFLLGRHLKRLHGSAEGLKIAIGLTASELRSRVEETLASAGNPESNIRIILSMGLGEIDYGEGPARGPTLVIIVKPLPAHWGEREPNQAMRVALVSVVTSPPGSLIPRIKSSNLLNNLLAMREARANGAEEGIMLNYRGEVVEGSLTNVFLVKDGVIKTPCLDSGILAGITRELTLGIARELGFQAEETVVLPDELFKADEVFLTGTTKEIMPVATVNDCLVGEGKPGPITMTLFKAYREKVRDLMLEEPE